MKLWLRLIDLVVCLFILGIVMFLLKMNLTTGLCLGLVSLQDMYTHKCFVISDNLVIDMSVCQASSTTSTLVRELGALRDAAFLKQAALGLI